jgi:hypothetical protein
MCIPAMGKRSRRKVSDEEGSSSMSALYEPVYEAHLERYLQRKAELAKISRRVGRRGVGRKAKAILQLIDHEWMTCRELSEATELEIEVVSSTLARLVAMGRAMKRPCIRQRRSDCTQFRQTNAQLTEWKATA